MFALVLFDEVFDVLERGLLLPGGLLGGVASPLDAVEGFVLDELLADELLDFVHPISI